MGYRSCSCLSDWLCVPLRPSAAQEEITELFPQVSHPSFARGKKSPSKHFFPSSPLKPASDDGFCRCSDFLSLLLLLIFVLPSKYSKWLNIWPGLKRRLLTHSPSIFCFSFSLSFPLHVLLISFISLLFFPLRTQSLSPKTIITSLVMQLADRLILQKELNPTAQHQQIILSAKPAFPFWNNALIYTRVTLKFMQEKAERGGGDRKKDMKTDCTEFSAENYFKRGCRSLGVWENAKKKFNFLAIDGHFLPCFKPTEKGQILSLNIAAIPLCQPHHQQLHSNWTSQV